MAVEIGLGKSLMNQEDCFADESFEFGEGKDDCLKEKSFDIEGNAGSSKNRQKEGAVPADDGDEVVVDVSPSGHSLATLDNYINQSSRIPRVKEMYVFDNSFTVLPRSLSRLTSLRSLKIFSNEVRLLPDEVGKIDLLEHLQVKVNPAGLGKLPPLCKLSSLKTLELHQTPLRPSMFSFPSEVSNLQMLTRLVVCNFSLTFLPPEIGELKNLEELDLSFNKLKVLPKELCNLWALKHFRAQNNKLMELPSGLHFLSNLSSIDVAHNRLTSLESLGLTSMTSLRALNAEFNKLKNTSTIPDWVTCRLEGNPFVPSETLPSASDGSDDLTSTDLPSLTANPEEVTSAAPLVTTPSKDVHVQKAGRHDKHKRGWKKQGVQPLQARQEKLNLSRKAKGEVSTEAGGLVSIGEMQAEMEELPLSRLSSSSLHEDLLTIEADSDTLDVEVAQLREDENIVEPPFDTSRNHTRKSCKISVDTLVETGSNSFNGEISVTSHCRKIINGHRSKQSSSKQDAASEVGHAFTFTSKADSEHGLVHGRRKGGNSDKNPKPTKRRKSTQTYSEASFVYRTKSVVGFKERLLDGFYDAGRENAFAALEDLKSQPPFFDSREVILVDREQDEELDGIALLAQNFLTKFESAGGYMGQTFTCGLNTFQKTVMLALFVSDCFGGSDKTLSVANARRAALGGRPGIPFLCSCSLPSSHELNQVSVPTVHQLCETSVKLLKGQRQSNVVPLGLLPYGVCRHRAILLKYLCDRASVPCELVRGYLDYLPHAWNVILVNKGGGSVRMLVDACRPLDVREERDSEYFCRYIPFRRFQLPSQQEASVQGVSEEIVPILLEEIGHGASGSVVQKCLLGSTTAAAKVHLFDEASRTKPTDDDDVVNRFLSELRIFCSLGEHPHIVSYYGHEFSGRRVMSHYGRDEAVQLNIYMEFVPGSSLEMVLLTLAKEGRRHVPVKTATYILKAVADALSFVHSRGIVHRDLKSSNVLVDTNGDLEDATLPVKLCDFDSAVPLSSSAAHTCYLAHRGIPPVEVCVGTPRWMAPEVFRAMYDQSRYGYEADMWSFGCLLLEMLTLQVPYAGLPEAQIQSLIQTGVRPPLPSALEELVCKSPAAVAAAEDEISKWSSLSEAELDMLRVLVTLYRSCTDPIPASRPTAVEALNTLSVLLENCSGDAGSKSDNEDKPSKPADESYCEERNANASSGMRQNKVDALQVCDDRNSGLILSKEMKG